jgi:hypothetical protein
VAGLTTPARAVQALSLLLTGVFLAFGAATFCRLLSQTWQQTLATALVAFWPYTIIQSSRINPDVAVNALCAVALYCAARWWQERETRWLLGAAVLAIAATWAKATGLTLVAALLVLSAVATWRSPNRRAEARKSAPLAVGLALAALLLVSFRGERGDGLARSILGNAYQTPPDAPSPPSALYYLQFDVRAFFDRPYVETGAFQSREPTFWNLWLKSSLFGGLNNADLSASVVGPPNASFALGLAALLLAVLAFLVLGTMLTWRQASPSRQFGAVVVLVYLVAAIGFHNHIPSRFHADFRFAFPLTIPLALLVSDAAGHLRSRRVWLWHAGYMLTCQWAALSGAYVVPLGRAPGIGQSPERATPSLSTAAPAAGAGSSGRATKRIPRGATTADRFRGTR